MIFKVCTIALSAAMLLSCHPSAENEILGSWMGCLDNQYVEIHFSQEVYFVFYPHDPSPAIRKYVIKNDSLFVFEYPDKEEKSFLFQIKMDNNQLILQSGGHPTFLDRLPSEPGINLSISKRPKELSAYLQRLSNRYGKSSCYAEQSIDYSEMELDSIQFDESLGL